MTVISRETFDQVMVPNYAPAAMVPDRASGARLWDRDGRDYVDFGAGIAVTSLGHCHPELVEALTAQANRLWHVSNVLTNEPALRLASRLVDLTFAERVFFANSGSEANEAALKLARRVAFDRDGESRRKIVACNDSFHGRTLFTVSVGGQPKYCEGFGPLPGAIEHIPFNDVDALERVIDASTCAFIVEPVQGEGGVTAASPAFLQRARELCSQHEALLIFDEVQCGNGRTGSLYAYQHYGITPDILTTAKALGGGFPISAMLTTADLAAHLAVGTHGSTYGGNPLATAVGDKALEILSRPETLAGVTERRATIEARLQELNDELAIFDEFRGLGLLMGARLAAPYRGRARDILTAAQQQGLLTLVAGPDVVRIAPSLLITPDELNDGLSRMETALRQIANS